MAVAKTLTRGGAATGATNTIAAIKAAGADVVALDGYAAQDSRAIQLVRKIERGYEHLAHGPNVHCLRLGPAVFDLGKLYSEFRPDVVQLFDVSGNTINFRDLRELPCPVVHRLSDCWPYLGARHYSEGSSTGSWLPDLLMRKTIFDGAQVPDMLVAPSAWMTHQVEDLPVRLIRNAVKPQDMAKPRALSGKHLRFGFISNPIDDLRKGLDRIPRVLRALTDSLFRVDLHLFGSGADSMRFSIPGVHVVAHSPFSRDDIFNVYSNFDILLCPSRRDNSPNVVTEALSCGVPVIGQSGTGIESYLEAPSGHPVDFDNCSSEEFRHVVEEISVRYPIASAHALEYSRTQLSPEEIGRQYIRLYSDLLL